MGTRGDHLVGIAANGNIAGSDAQVVQGRDASVLAGPKQVRAVAEIAGAGEDHPEQERASEARPMPSEDQQRFIGQQLFGFGFARDLERVGGEQIDESDRGDFPARSAKVTRRCWKSRKRIFGGASSLAPVQAAQGKVQAQANAAAAIARRQ